jgi:hypothetical protein
LLVFLGASLRAIEGAPVRAPFASTLTTCFAPNVLYRANAPDE